MNKPNATQEMSPNSKFSLYRKLFVTGYAINIVLWFIPSMKVKVGAFMGMGGEEKTFSMLTLVQELSRQGNLGMMMFMVLIFATNIVFIVLAFKLPRRWMFITASSIAAFFVLMNLFSGSNDAVQQFFLPLILEWVASLLSLLGFVIKPPTNSPINHAAPPDDKS